MADRTEDENRWSTLMTRAQQGDGPAYEQLLGELTPVIEHYIRARFGRPAMLEDLVQECLLGLHRARASYDPRRPFRPWMFTVVHHRVIDLLRRTDHGAPGATDRTADVDSGVDTGVDTGELIDGARLLQDIGIDQRDAIVLVKYAGYTASEAAGRLGITESALKARLRRGLRAIARRLNSEDPRR